MTVTRFLPVMPTSRFGSFSANDDVLFRPDRHGINHDRDQVLAGDAELLFQPLERHEEASSSMPTATDPHDRDQVLPRDAELLSSR